MKPTLQHKTNQGWLKRCSRTCFRSLYLDGHSVASLGGDDAVVHVVVDLIIVNGQEVTVVVRVEAVHCVVVHLVSSPVPLLVAVRVDPEMVVVDV